MKRPGAGLKADYEANGGQRSNLAYGLVCKESSFGG